MGTRVIHYFLPQGRRETHTYEASSYVCCMLLAASVRLCKKEMDMRKTWLVCE